MPPRGACAAALLAVAVSLGAAAGPVRAPKPIVETMDVRRHAFTIRLEEKVFAQPGECDALAPEDLDVRVDGEPATVAEVDRLPRPRMHWLLVDTSESADEQRERAKKAAARYVREVLDPERDEAAVLTVDEDLRLLAGPTSDFEALAEAIEAVPPGGQSFLMDGVDEVLAQIAGDSREHVVLFWTDGDDTLSVQTIQALRARLAAVPNARVFPVAIQGWAGKSPRAPDSLLYELAEGSGGRVLLAADRRWIDQIRTAVNRRWSVTVLPPSDSPVRADAKLRVEVRGRRCEAVVIPDAWPDPPPASPAAVPQTWLRDYRHQRHAADDPICVEEPGTGGEMEAGDGWVSGCALDIVQEQGILYYDKSPYRADLLTPVRFAQRRFFVDAPAPADLPDAAWKVLDVLADFPLAEVGGDDEDVPSPASNPLLMHGRAFLTQQTRIARALWDSQPAWRDFARSRLEVRADRDVSRLADELRDAMPALSEEEAKAAAGASPLGRRAREAAERPSDFDLARVAGAWLGDVSAQEIFFRWERSLLDRVLAGELAPEEAERRWASVRRWFALPEKARSLVPLVPCLDDDRRIAGFWRVFPPRAVWIAERRAGARREEAIPYDMIPLRPLGLWVWERARIDRPSLAASWDRHDWRVESIETLPVGKLWKEEPALPYRSADVRVVLRDTDARLTIAARVDTAKDGSSSITGFRAEAEGDEALAAACEAASDLGPNADGRAHPR